MMFDQQTKDRFWSKVERRGPLECWPWLPSQAAGTRGSFSLNGRTATAPNAALTLTKGEAPEGKPFACHTCDNPNCVNPAHLWWGSNQDNIRDAASKGRLPLQKIASCKYGHPFDAINTRYNSRGQRQCRECQKVWRSRDKQLRKVRRAALKLEGTCHG